MYVRPICIGAFPPASVVSGELTAEHVPPLSFGGRELVLTCRACNNTAGSKLDAHARQKEDIAEAIRGELGRVQKVNVAFGGVSVNAELPPSEQTAFRWR